MPQFPIMKVTLMITKWVSFFIVMLACVCLGQFGQVVTTKNELRIDGYKQWMDGDKKREIQVAAFLTTCVFKQSLQTGANSPNTNQVEVCAAENGYQELFDAGQRANDSIKSFAWPLSLFSPAL